MKDAGCGRERKLRKAVVWAGDQLNMTPWELKSVDGILESVPPRDKGVNWNQ